MKSFKEALLEEIEVEECITKEDLIDLIEELDPEDYAEVAELIIDLVEGNYDGLDYDEDEEGVLESEDEDEDEEIDEAVTARFKNKDKSIRRFAKSKAQLKKDKIKNKIKNRKNRIKNKLYRRKNKMKIKKYQKSRNDAIKRGLHRTTKRRGA